ncbi:MAG: proprotein convertase P-domain-containing protein [Chitinophagaceae bacterium]|nr:proprotein convertase P-domain-containing protein [Chitinophagaceae bacterium]
MKNVCFPVICLLLAQAVNAQNVGIGTTNPSEQLHTTKGVKHEILKGAGTRFVMADSSGKLLAQKDSAYSAVASPSLPIESNCTGSSSSLTVSGLPSVVPSSGIAVKLNISHDHVADLQVFLVAPNGNIINLISNNGDDATGFINTIFTDTAAAGLPQNSGAGAPFSGYYKPTAYMNSFSAGFANLPCWAQANVNSFSAMGGGSINPNGVWTLQLFDSAGNGYYGTLNNWSVMINDKATGGDNYLAKWQNGNLNTSSVYDNGTSVAIGTKSPAPSAILELRDSTKGFLPPRMSYANRFAIANPVAGLVIWCTNCGPSGELQVYNGTTWTNMIGGTASAATVTIGDQVWMAKNLEVTNYRNGDPIPQVTDPTQWASLTSGAWCWYNNDSVLGAIYGKIYNFYAVTDPRGLAPAGWHIPTMQEWYNPEYYLGGDGVTGGKLKSVNYWNSPNGGGTNSSGFTALPGGYRFDNGGFGGMGQKAGGGLLKPVWATLGPIFCITIMQVPLLTPVFHLKMVHLYAV